jgi:hypothetical protein
MKRLIFFATFIPAVFLVDLLASSARLSNDPVAINIQRPAPAVVTKPRVPEKVEQNVRFVCNDKAFSFVLNKLRENDNPDFGREYIDGFIEALGIRNCSELFAIDKTVDLNGDGIEEIFVRTKNSSKGCFYCEATGNCTFWVLRRDKNRYRILFNVEVTKDVLVQKLRSGNYKDLVARYEGGMMDHTLAYYTYRAGKYALRNCIKETMNTDGKMHRIREELRYCE